jgi:hypothetical protein
MVRGRTYRLRIRLASGNTINTSQWAHDLWQAQYLIQRRYPRGVVMQVVNERSKKVRPSSQIDPLPRVAASMSQLGVVGCGLAALAVSDDEHQPILPVLSNTAYLTNARSSRTRVVRGSGHPSFGARGDTESPGCPACRVSEQWPRLSQISPFFIGHRDPALVNLRIQEAGRDASYRHKHCSGRVYQLR